MQPKIVQHIFQTFLHKTRLLFVLLGEMYIIFILFIAVIIAALITFLSYLPLIIVGRIGNTTLYRKDFMVN